MQFNLDLKGSCVTREALEHTSEIDINKYWFQKPLVSIFSEELNISEDNIQELKLLLANMNMSNFIIRTQTESIKKSFFNEYEKKDYFLIDLIDERMSLMEINENTYIEYRRHIYNFLKDFYNIKVVKNNFNLFKKACDCFFNELLKYYKEEEIILHKAYAITKLKINDTIYELEEFFYDKDEKVKKYYSNENANNFNEFFSQCYEYIERNWPKVKVIEIDIEKCFLDIDHRLGNNFFHYEEEYYISFLEQLFDILNNNYNYERVAKIIEKNKKNIEKKFNFDQNDKLIEYKDINGQILLKKEFLNNSLKKECFYSELGELEKIVEYQNNNVSNVKIYECDKKIKEMTYTNGLLYEIKYYNFNGKIRRKIHYSKFSPIGVPQIEEKFNSMGIRTSYKTFYSTGEMSRINKYDKKGLLEKIYYLNKNGCVYKEKIYSDGLIKLEISYKENKVDKEIVYSKEGLKIEIFKYNEEGTLVSHMKRENKNTNWKDIEIES
jgi:hypothetical protein